MKTIAAIIGLTAFAVYASNETTLQSTSTTNIGGWQVTLSIPTNPISMGTNITVTLTVSNASQAGGYLGWSWSPAECPGFGRINITDKLTHEDFPFCGKPWSWVDERGGSIGPTDGMSFNFDLTENYCVKKAGEYDIGFHGSLRSLEKPTEIITFDMPPLRLLVEGVKAKTNAPSATPVR